MDASVTRVASRRPRTDGYWQDHTCLAGLARTGQTVHDESWAGEARHPIITRCSGRWSQVDSPYGSTRRDARQQIFGNLDRTR